MIPQRVFRFFSDRLIYHQDRMKPLVKRVLTLLAFLAVLSTVVVGIRYKLKEKAQKKREAAYESSLRSYRQELKPGMTRKEVEGYLKAKNTPLMRMCCVDSGGNRSSLDDLTRIGQEDAPWFCSENNVYIAFQFSEYERHDGMPSANDLDTLKTVSIYRWLEGCL